MINLAPFAEQLLPYILVAGRMGGALSTLPGYSEVFVNTRVRAALMFALSLAITPMVAPEVISDPGFPPFLILKELIIGLLFGVLIKMVLMGLEVAGTIISFQMGFSNAMSQTAIISSALPSTFLVTIMILLIFISNMHHLMLEAIVATYKAFPLMPSQPGSLTLLFSHALEQATEILSVGFRLSLQLAAPLLIVNMILNAGFALFNRLIPSIQVFAIMIPLQIIVGVIVFAMSIHLTLSLFAEHLGNLLHSILQQ